MAEFTHSVNEKEQEQAVEAVPAGEYIAVIEDSDYAENKKGTGMLLKLTYQILDGPFKGRKVFENLGLEHENAQTAQIARRALNSICIAIGIPDGQKLQDTAQLHDIPMKIDVVVKENKEYGKQNNIRKHIKLDGTTNQPAPPEQDQVNGNGGRAKKPAWEK